MMTSERIIEKFSAALGTDLRSALLYGSSADAAARRPADINLMLVVARADAETLRKIAVAVREWVAGGNPAPIVIADAEVHRSFDVFPIEFSDIKERHRLLHGRADWLDTVAVRPTHLRHQLEFELRSKMLLLRQAWLATAGRSAAEEEALGHLQSPVTALFRAALRLLGEPVPAATPDVARALQARVNIDAPAWEAVWQLRHGTRPPKETISGLFPRLLAGLETLVNFVDAYVAS
jgi:hypothetical protein